MMTLEEAINHAKEVAEKNRKCHEENTIILSNRWISSMCCAEEHEQLAKWLEELKELRRKSKWIPCSERLPEKEDYFVITVAYKGSVFSDAGKYMINSEGQGEFHPGIENFAPYSVIGAKVIAWMPLPEPYRQNDKGVDASE